MEFKGFNNYAELRKDIGLVEDDKRTEMLNIDKEAIHNLKPESNPIKFIYEDAEGKTKIDLEKLCFEVQRRNKYVAVCTGTLEEVHVYREGVWLKEGVELIRREVEDLAGELCKLNLVREVVDKIKRKTLINKEEFDNLPDFCVCIKNGVLNLKTKELTQHSDKYYFKSKLPLIFDETKQCPNILLFLNDVLNPEDINLVQEWLGFCLLNKYMFKKSIIFFGSKDTGKTVLLNLIIAFLGECNTSGISLQKICVNDRFSVCALENRFANIYDDLSAQDMSDASGFKIACGGGWMSAEKKFGDCYKFRNFAKLIFSCNQIPKITEMDGANEEAYYDRWFPIPLENQIPTEEQNFNLLGSITTPDELSGLLNWALEGLHRLLERKKFSFSKKWEDVKTMMLRHNSHLLDFVCENLAEAPLGEISKADLHEFYLLWCAKKSITPLTKEQLGRRLPHFAKKIIAQGGAERVWRGYSLISNYKGVT